MSGRVIMEKQDLTYLQWSRVRNSSGTAGTFLKSESRLDGGKVYYKLSNYDPQRGVVGHECFNEIVVDRLLDILGVEHLNYDLIHADIEVDGRVWETYICASKDFKKRGESKVTLENYYRGNALPGESRYDFCVRNGWKDTIDTMIAVDYIILNRDRHGANIEVLRNPWEHTLRIAPLFDHGLSLLFSCMSEEEIRKFDILEDKRCQNYIGGYSTYENLGLLNGRKDLFSGKLMPEDRDRIFEGFEDALPATLMDKMSNMIYERYKVYETL